MAAPHPALPPNPHAATDAGWMRRALAQAELAAANDEIPIGAVVVLENRLIGQGYNQTERLRDVTAHAEMLALTAAANTIGNKYLLGATLYCTVEPCPMCAGALAWAQVARVVFGVRDEKRGLHRFQPALLHPRTQVTGGILADECAALMQAFFRERR